MRTSVVLRSVALRDLNDPASGWTVDFLVMVDGEPDFAVPITLDNETEETDLIGAAYRKLHETISTLATRLSSRD